MASASSFDVSAPSKLSITHWRARMKEWSVFRTSCLTSPLIDVLTVLSYNRRTACAKLGLVRILLMASRRPVSITETSCPRYVLLAPGANHNTNITFALSDTCCLCSLHIDHSSKWAELQYLKRVLPTRYLLESYACPRFLQAVSFIVSQSHGHRVLSFDDMDAQQSSEATITAIDNSMFFLCVVLPLCSQINFPRPKLPFL